MSATRHGTAGRLGETISAADRAGQRNVAGQAIVPERTGTDALIAPPRVGLVRVDNEHGTLAD